VAQKRLNMSQRGIDTSSRVWDKKTTLTRSAEATETPQQETKALNMKKLVTLAVVSGFCIGSTTSAWASFDAVGDTLSGNSWGQVFREMNVGSFDRITATVSGGLFESFSEDSHTWSSSLDNENTQGSFSHSPGATTIGFTAWFQGSLEQQNTVSLLLRSWYKDLLIDQACATWNYDDHHGKWCCHFVPAPIPEPTTMIAGALLLLPFGASTIRILRKIRAA
jgi:hypothetical protein